MTYVTIRQCITPPWVGSMHRSQTSLLRVEKLFLPWCCLELMFFVLLFFFSDSLSFWPKVYWLYSFYLFIFNANVKTNSSSATYNHITTPITNNSSSKTSEYYFKWKTMHSMIYGVVLCSFSFLCRDQHLKSLLVFVSKEWPTHKNSVFCVCNTQSLKKIKVHQTY